MNYFSLIDEIKQVSLRYSEEFYEGDIYEYLNSGNHKYPCIILTVQNITTDDDVNTISATIFAVDRLTNDSSNKLEVQSLCMSKITQILGTLEERVSRIQSNTLTPFTEKFSDLCGGMYGEFTLEYIGNCICDEGIQYKEIELTRNGIYDIIGYDKAIVNIQLEELNVTSNGEYLPTAPNEGFNKVIVEIPKVKLTSFDVRNECINEEGRWEGEDKVDLSTCISFSFYRSTKLKYLDTRNWDTSNITSLSQAFDSITNEGIKIDGIENWDVSNVTTIYCAFRGVVFSEPVVDLRNWNTESLKRIANCFIIRNEGYLNLEGWNTKNVTDAAQCFTTNSLTKLNIVGWDFSNCTNVLQFLNGRNLTSWVGDYTIDEVIENNISTLIGLKVSLTIESGYHYPTMLNRASLRALINGLADLTGQTTQTLTIGEPLIAKLTEEDIAIAVNKNWTIA